MQAYQPENNTSPDPIRRILLGAFLLSAVVTLLLAFCSRKSPGQPTPAIVDNGAESTNQTSNQAQPTLDDTRLLQTNANRPGYKDLNLDQTIYFLLTGLDKREWEGDTGPGLTDTIIVAFLDVREEKAGMISIPRDTWAEVPEFGPYKINQAYSLGEAYGYPGGGPGLLMDTAGNLLGIDIDYYVQVDFEAFVVLVDAVDGVLVDVPQEILVWPNAEMEGDMKRIMPGKQVLPGNLALGYVRTRDTDEGDFGRTKRQQQVLVGLQKKVFSYDILPVVIPRLPAIYRDLSSNVETNLSLSQIISLGWAVRDINPQSLHTRIIKEPVVEAGINERDQYVLFPDIEQIRNIWHDMQEISATPIPEPTYEVTLEEYILQENASIAILNGTSSPGLAGETADFLITNGVNITEVGNSDKFKDQTYIYDYTGNPYTIQSILSVMNYSQNRLFHRSDPDTAADIVIILGADWILDNPMTGSD
ncbi:MAG: LCP family protein [Anaerolineales bacterium]|nr:LCP family protein [Anaerolineales bacterium]